MVKPIDELKAYLERSQQTQADLADKLGVSQAYVSMLLNGNRVPGLRTALALEQITGVSCRSWVTGIALERRRKPRREGARRFTDRQSGQPDRRKEPR